MKKIFFVLATTIAIMGLRAQNFEVLTPKKVKISKRWAKTRLNQARILFLAWERKNFSGAEPQWPAGISFFWTTEDRLVSFQKVDSRQGATDKIFLLPAGSPVFIHAGGYHYPYCMNKFSSFEPVPVRTRTEVIIRKSPSQETNEEESTQEGGWTEVQETPQSLLLQQPAATTPAPEPVIIPTKKKSWFGRNWKWLVPTAIAVGAGAYALLHRPAPTPAPAPEPETPPTGPDGGDDSNNGGTPPTGPEGRPSAAPPKISFGVGAIPTPNGISGGVSFSVRF